MLAWCKIHEAKTSMRYFSSDTSNHSVNNDVWVSHNCYVEQSHKCSSIGPACKCTTMTKQPENDVYRKGKITKCLKTQEMQQHSENTKQVTRTLTTTQDMRKHRPPKYSR